MTLPLRWSATALFIGAILLAAPALAEENNLVHADAAPSSGDYIVTLKDKADPDEVSTRIEKRLKRGLARTHTYRSALKGFAAHLSKDEVAALKSDADVESIVEDQAVSILAGKVTAQAQTLPTGINRIDAENKTNKGAGVQVAVIDTGIDYSHPDLISNVIGGKNCSTGNSYRDGNGHGTHVAGTIAALGNSVGVVGVAPKASLWAVRVLDNNGNGTWSSVICGIDFVTSKGPKNGGKITLANMSLGGAGVSDNNCGNSTTGPGSNDPLHKAICRARDAGVTIVVAAGNNAGDATQTVPAAYDDAVITVSALADSDGVGSGLGAATSYGADDTFATFSNYGTPVDIGAPGVNILSTWRGGGYATISGTSMATPHVTGAAALYIATHPGASWTAVRDGLKALGEAVGAGHTDPSGIHPEPVLKANTL